MNIDKDHMYHGAALLQIAEDPHFTSINNLKLRHVSLRNAFRINNDIYVYLKYASKAAGHYGEYRFNFKDYELEQLKDVAKRGKKFFMGLVCVDAKEICCLSYDSLCRLVKRRQESAQIREEQYVICVTAQKGKKLRVYVNVPGRKGQFLGQEIRINRKDFPIRLFK